MPVRRDTWNTTASRPDLVDLIGSKCRAREAWRVPLDPLTPGALAGSLMSVPLRAFQSFTDSTGPDPASASPEIDWQTHLRLGGGGVLTTPRRKAFDW